MNIFEDIIDKVAHRLVGRSFENANYRTLTITRRDFSYWVELMEEFFENFFAENFNSLQMIIIASSGAQGFNDAYAMVSRRSLPDRIPPTVVKLLKCFYYSLQEDPDYFETPLPDSPYDYRCTQLRTSVLFFNVCLSDDNRDHCNAVCSIAFINELLKGFNEHNGRKLAVLDFRLAMHKHVDNISGNFWEENNWSDDPSFRQEDYLYKIVNPESYHFYYSLCHPLGLELDEIPNDEFIIFKNVFTEIANMGYPIRLMYMPPGSCWN